MKKTLSAILLACLFAATANSQTLSEVIKKTNANLPRSFELYTFQQFYFEDDICLLQMTLHGDEILNSEYLTRDPQATKVWFRYFTMGIYNFYPNVLDKVVAGSANLSVYFHDVSYDRKFLATYTNQELKDILDEYRRIGKNTFIIKLEQAYSNLLKGLQLADELTTSLGAEVTSDAFIYKFEVDEDYINIADLQANMKIGRKAVLSESLQTDKTKPFSFFSALKATKRKLKQIYIGSITGKTASVTYTPNEF